MFKIKRIALFVTLGCTLVACNNNSISILEELNDNRATWEAQNFSTYSLTFSHNCNCLDEVTATREALIENNAVTSQVLKDGYKRLRTEDFQAWTVNELFELIALEESRADFLTVEYNELYGYPTFIQVDRDKQVADDEYTITVTNMVPAELVECQSTEPYGAIFTITDAGAVTAEACGVTITSVDNAEDSNFSETIVNDDSACMDEATVEILVGQTGFFDITIEKDNFQTATITDFGIGEGLCGAYPRYFNVELVAE